MKVLTHVFKSTCRIYCGGKIGRVARLFHTLVRRLIPDTTTEIGFSHLSVGVPSVFV